MKKIFVYQVLLLLFSLGFVAASCGDDEENIKPKTYEYVDKIVDIDGIRYKISTDGSASVIGSRENGNIEFVQFVVDGRSAPSHPVGNNISDYKGSLVIPREISFGGATYTVTSIKSFAFLDCSNLTSVVIPISVTSIGDWAFCGCSSLKSVNIPEGLTNIDEGVFFNCKSLTSVNIPNSVTRIGKQAFSSCSGLISINIPNSVASIGDYAFHYCSGLTSVIIPDGVTSIGELAFSSCSSLTSVTIGNSVTSIGMSAFGGCSGLTQITCKAEIVPRMINTAFYNVSLNSATLYVPQTSLADYKAHEQWGKFGEILPIE